MRFTVYGEPTAKGRPKFSTHGGFVKAYTPEKTAAYENLVKLSFDQQVAEGLIQEEVIATITAYFSIPKSTSKATSHKDVCKLNCRDRRPRLSEKTKI